MIWHPLLKRAKKHKSVFSKDFENENTSNCAPAGQNTSIVCPGNDTIYENDNSQLATCNKTKDIGNVQLVPKKVFK